MCVLWVVVVLHQGNQGEEQRHVQGEDGAYSWFRLRLVFYTGCDLLDRMVGDTDRVKPSYQPTRLLAECLRGLLVQGSMNRQIPPCAMKYSLNSCGHLSVVERSRVMGKVGGSQAQVLRHLPSTHSASGLGLQKVPRCISDSEREEAVSNCALSTLLCSGWRRRVGAMLCLMAPVFTQEYQSSPPCSLKGH